MWVSKEALDAILSQINKKIGDRFYSQWYRRRLNYQFSNYVTDKVNGSRVQPSIFGEDQRPDPGDSGNRAEAGERQRKRGSRRQASEAQREKGRQSLARGIKNKGDIFLLGEQHENFVEALTKWEMLAAKVKMSDSEKKVNENTCDNSSIKRVTKKFLEVSHSSRAKQRQRNVQKMCAVRAKLLFCKLDLLFFFTVLRRCLRRLVLHDFVFCLNKLQILSFDANVSSFSLAESPPRDLQITAYK